MGHEVTMREGVRLMRENPVDGFNTPAEKNPRRPVASHDRYGAVRAVVAVARNTRGRDVGNAW